MTELLKSNGREARCVGIEKEPSYARQIRQIPQIVIVIPLISETYHAKIVQVLIHPADQVGLGTKRRTFEDRDRPHMVFNQPFNTLGSVRIRECDLRRLLTHRRRCAGQSRNKKTQKEKTQTQNDRPNHHTILRCEHFIVAGIHGIVSCGLIAAICETPAEPLIPAPICGDAHAEAELEWRLLTSA